MSKSGMEHESYLDVERQWETYYKERLYQEIEMIHNNEPDLEWYGTSTGVYQGDPTYLLKTRKAILDKDKELVPDQNLIVGLPYFVQLQEASLAQVSFATEYAQYQKDVTQWAEQLETLRLENAQLQARIDMLFTMIDMDLFEVETP